MINDRAMVETEATTWPTYADRVEMGYKAFEIGLWELSRDNHDGAGSWLRTAVDFGVEDARALMDICVSAGRSTPAGPTTPHPPVADASTALGAFAADFATRPAHERRAALNWFPRRQLAILRSVALLTIRTRDLVRALDRARDLDRDRILARDVYRDPVRAGASTDELAIALAQAHGGAVELRHVLDRDRASELAPTRDLVRGLARDLATARRVFAHDVDCDLSRVLNPVRDRAIVHELARVRDRAIVHARDLAIGRAIDPVRVREVALAHVRSGDRDLGLDEALIRDVDRDAASTIALDLASALDRDRDHDAETSDRELIEAVERLEKALSPATQPRDGREAN